MKGEGSEEIGRKRFEIGDGRQEAADGRKVRMEEKF